MMSEKSKWEDKAVVESYKGHAQTISEKILKGAPVQVDLCDDSLAPKVSINSK